MIYNGLGEREETLAWLERAADQRDVLLSAFVSVDPNWEKSRSNPRLTAILSQMKLE